VLPLDGHEQLAAYFDRFMLPRSKAAACVIVPSPLAGEGSS